MGNGDQTLQSHSTESITRANPSRRKNNMKNLTAQGEHAINHASAHVNAILAMAEAAIEALLEGTHSDNQDLAQAVKLILDDQAEALEHWMERLEQAVMEHHPDPAHIEQPRTHAAYATRVQQATERYERHLETRFPAVHEGNAEHTPDSVFHTLTTAPVTINRAVRRLAGEIASREPESPARVAYIETLLEIAAMLPNQSEVLSRSRQADPPDTSWKDYLMQRAQDAALDTETLEALYRGPDPGATAEDQDDVPWVSLQDIYFTLQGLRVINGMADAHALALACGTKLTQTTTLPGDRRLQVNLQDPPTTIEIDAQETLDEPAGSKITIEIQDENNSLKEELRQAARILAVAASRAHSPNSPQEETVLRTRMCMGTDRLPAGQTDTRHAEPISEGFLTPAGHRCLNAITWERDDDIEQAVLQEEGEVITSYLFWSDSVTTIGPRPDPEELLEIIMATYTLGGRFLLQEHLDSPQNH